MKPLLYYGLQLFLASGILYGYYHFFLRNKAFHKYNRFYLLAASLLSVALPFLDIPVYFTATRTEPSLVFQTLAAISPEETDTVTVLRSPYPSSGTGTDTNLLFQYAYIIIAAVFFARILVSLVKIRKIARNYPREKQDRIYFVNTSEPGTPFSFFRWLFWNKNIELRSEKGEQIFRHELFHIRQGHSWDVLYMELLSTLFWINPFFHLMKKELRTIHEFLADQHAASGSSRWQYAEMLLMQILQTRQSLVNPFFQTQLKRRIAMITSSPQTSFRYLRKLLVLPVALIAIGLTAFSFKPKKLSLSAAKPVTVMIDAGHGGEDPGAIAGDGTAEKEITLALARKIEALNSDPRVKILLCRNTDTRVPVQDAVAKTKTAEADLFISLHLSANADAKTRQTGFRVFVSGKDVPYARENNTLASLLLSSFGKDLAAEPLIRRQNSGIYVLDHAPCPAVLLECGFINNTNDLAYLMSEEGQSAIARNVLRSIAQFSRAAETGATTAVTTTRDTVRPIVIVRNGNPASQPAQKSVVVKKETASPAWNDPLIVVDNIIQGPVEAKDILQRMDPSVIQSISVYKDEKAREKYGDAGKNGVIEIQTKKTDPLADTTRKPVPDRIIFDKVETEPSFPGGLTAWRRFLEANLNPMIPLDKKAPEGTYTVITQFIVDKEGYITDVKTLTHHGYGMEEEAIRVIKKGPRWTPALQNGLVVTAYKKQPITFVIRDETKKNTPVTVNSRESLPEIVVVGFKKENK